MSRRLGDLAEVVRSKNAGPTVMTIDVIFGDEAGYRAGLGAITAQVVGRLHGVAENDVKIAPYPQALAVKIAFPRAVMAGSPGDRDVYGAQQHGPLMELEI